MTTPSVTNHAGRLIPGQPVQVWDALQGLFESLGINDHVLHATVSYPGRIDERVLRAALDATLGPFPLLASSLQVDGDAAWWQPSEATAADIMHVIVPEGDVQAAVDHFLAQTMEPENDAQIAAAIVRDLAGGDVLALRVNHMVTDAAGLKEYLAVLAHVYTDIARGVEPGDAIADAVVGSRRIDQIVPHLPAEERASIDAGGGRGPSHDAWAYPLAGEADAPAIVRHRIDRVSFAAVRAAAKQRRATVNDAFIAALVRVVGEDASRRVVMPFAMDLRRYLPRERAAVFCNLIVTGTCDPWEGTVGTEPVDEPFGATLDRVHLAMDGHKRDLSPLGFLLRAERDFDELPYPQAIERLRSVYSNAPVAFTNIGVVEAEPLALAGMRPVDAFITGSIKYAPYVQVALSTFDGEATLSVGLRATRADLELMRGVLWRVADELVRWAYR